MEQILKIRIDITEEHELKSRLGTARQVLFTGNCEGKYFNGKILNGGVDTQFFRPDGKGSLSARYMLSGVDNTGKECMMFIDNSGSASSDDNTTHPIIYTDSEALNWLENEKLSGRIEVEDGKIVIYINKV